MTKPLPYELVNAALGAGGQRVTLFNFGTTGTSVTIRPRYMSDSGTVDSNLLMAGALAILSAAAVEGGRLEDFEVLRSEGDTILSGDGKSSVEDTPIVVTLKPATATEGDDNSAGDPPDETSEL